MDSLLRLFLLGLVAALILIAITLAAISMFSTPNCGLGFHGVASDLVKSGKTFEAKNRVSFPQGTVASSDVAGSAGVEFVCADPAFCSSSSAPLELSKDKVTVKGVSGFNAFFGQKCLAGVVVVCRKTGSENVKIIVGSKLVETNAFAEKECGE